MVIRRVGAQLCSTCLYSNWPGMSIKWVSCVVVPKLIHTSLKQWALDSRNVTLLNSVIIWTLTSKAWIKRKHVVCEDFPTLLFSSPSAMKKPGLDGICSGVDIFLSAAEQPSEEVSWFMSLNSRAYQRCAHARYILLKAFRFALKRRLSCAVQDLIP